MKALFLLTWSWVLQAGDALMQLLPIIGESPLGTASLITVTGICAPLLEETVFRGFLLPSLTKW
jgi:membrane protease YdiL (CAAX protease family)